MKCASVPSEYRNCILRDSVRTARNFSPARKVLSMTLPSEARRSFVRTNAPPLPGLTCWNSTILKTVPSTSMWLPFLNWLVEIMCCQEGRRRARIGRVDVAALAGRGRRPRFAALAQRVRRRGGGVRSGGSDAGGVRVRVVRAGGRRRRVAGAGPGPPLLLINGIGAPLEMWANFARRIRGRQVVMFDLPGSGRSQSPTLPMRMSGFARVTEALLDELDLPSVDVLGYSFGGAVAQELARRAPDRVRRLILCATFPGIPSVPPDPVVLALMATPLRYTSRTLGAWIVPRIAGGRTARDAR